MEHALAGSARVYAGAFAVTAGIAAFIEAHSHRPRWAYAGETVQQAQSEAELNAPQVHLGLTDAAYDLVRIGAWALVILGALTVILGALTVTLGLIRYWTAAKAATNAYAPERR